MITRLTWNIKYASAAQGPRPLGAWFVGIFSSSKLTSSRSGWSGLCSSSATTLSNTRDTSCLTVAPAVFIVVQSFVKCNRKQSTKFWKNIISCKTTLVVTMRIKSSKAISKCSLLLEYLHVPRHYSLTVELRSAKLWLPLYPTPSIAIKYPWYISRPSDLSLAELSAFASCLGKTAKQTYETKTYSFCSLRMFYGTKCHRKISGKGSFWYTLMIFTSLLSQPWTKG